MSFFAQRIDALDDWLATQADVAQQAAATSGSDAHQWPAHRRL